MKVDFKKIKLLDIDGKKMATEGELHKTIANLLFAWSVNNLDLVELARKINKGTTIDVSKSDIAKIKAVVLSVPIEKGGLLAYAKDAFTTFMDGIKE